MASPPETPTFRSFLLALAVVIILGGIGYAVSQRSSRASNPSLSSSISNNLPSAMPQPVATTGWVNYPLPATVGEIKIPPNAQVQTHAGSISLGVNGQTVTFVPATRPPAGFTQSLPGIAQQATITTESGQKIERYTAKSDSGQDTYVYYVDLSSLHQIIKGASASIEGTQNSPTLVPMLDTIISSLKTNP